VALAIGLDVHRAQITFDALDEETGEVKTGRIAPADRPTLRNFLADFAGQEVRAALEATTGWRFVCEELERIGAEAHLAELADTRALRGSKRRAKTDRLDARHLRELLSDGRLPESWIPPAHIAELRSQVRLRHTLVDERTAWLQRVHAVLFHQGVPRPGRLAGVDAQERLAELDLTPSARRQVDVALAMVGQINAHVAALDRELRSFARRQPGCLALMEHPGIGTRVAPPCWPSSETPGALLLAPRRPLCRARRHRRPVGRQAPSRPALSPGPARPALGRLRGGADGVSAQLARPRLLLEDEGAHRREPRLPVDRPQAHPPRPSHPARTRRRGPGTRRVIAAPPALCLSSR